MPENEEFHVDKSDDPRLQSQEGKKVIDEANYKIHAPQQKGPSVVGKGGDPLFMNIRASKAQLEELLDETTTVQDWIQRETCNSVALTCLNNENLKEAYFEIKDGFGEFGPIMLMGFKTPQGIEIPRLKVMDKNGEVIQVLTGPMAIEEISKRAMAYKNSTGSYEVIEKVLDESEMIQDYTGPIEDYNS